MKKAILTTAIVASLMASTALYATPENLPISMLPHSIEPIKNNLIGLEIEGKGINGEHIANCSGLVIDHHHILTAAHCVLDTSQTGAVTTSEKLYIIPNHNPNAKVEITSTEYKIAFPEGYHPAEQMLNFLEGRDVAIIKISDNKLQSYENIKKDIASSLYVTDKYLSHPETTEYYQLSARSNHSFHFNFQHFNYHSFRESKLTAIHLNDLGKFRHLIGFPGFSSEPGDSGGPIVACDGTHDGCKVIGVTSSTTKPDIDIFGTGTPAFFASSAIEYCQRI